ncbi:hypothetical protein [Roseburia zhanii]|nr:hypothetical protein [Roseburia zhanii]
MEKNIIYHGSNLEVAGPSFATSKHLHVFVLKEVTNYEKYLF